MAADGVLWFAIFAIGFGFNLVESTFPVPVFMWSKDSSDLGNGYPVLAGHTLSGKDFQVEYLQKLLKTPQIVCLFVQDKLSVDDISQYGQPYGSGQEAAAFANLEFAMKTANSTAVLPAVGTESSLLDYVKNNANGKIVEISSEDLSSFDIHQYSLDKDKVNLFIFHLKPVSMSSPPSVPKIFSENDKLLGTITRQFASLNVPYTGLLTALDPTESVYVRKAAAAASIQSGMSHDRLRREIGIEEQPSLSASNGSNPVIIDANGCVLISTEGITLKLTNNSVDILNQTNVKISSSAQCSNISSTSVNFTIIGSKYSFGAKMEFNTSNGIWFCTSMTADFGGKTYNFACADLQAPLKMSYHCGTWGQNGRANASLIFNQFQIQPYSVEGAQFSYAYDCVGFFTIPILMGLVTVAILLSILFLGIQALLGITTMDRFDDPKGPTISMGIIQE